MIRSLIVVFAACLAGARAAIWFLMAWLPYRGHDKAMATYQPRPEDEAAMAAIETWLANGDPLAHAPDREMGVFITCEQADELDALAAATWPQNEYFKIADLDIGGETS